MNNLAKDSTSAKIRTALILLFIIILVGISGYMTIEDDSFIDALYMTIITVSTVGFGEIHRLSMPGRIFTIFLIITSFGTYAYAISVITTHFVEGKLTYFIRGQRQKIMKKMENHIIICGYGRNGQQAANELKAHRDPFVVIDTDHKLIEGYLDSPIRLIEGDATQDEILEKADIKKARALITTLPNDADNLYVVITARAMNPDLLITSRAANINSEKKLRMAGVDHVVMPEKVGGTQMAKLVTRPDLLEFLDKLSISSETPTNLDELQCEHLHNDLINKSINESDIRKQTGVNIVGLKTSEGDYIINPDPEIRIMPNTKLFVLGTPDQIQKARQLLSKVSETSADKS